MLSIRIFQYLLQSIERRFAWRARSIDLAAVVNREDFDGAYGRHPPIEENPQVQTGLEIFSDITKYLAFSVLMVFVVLRRLVCTRCYYYGKRCGAGWGLLASALFTRGRMEQFNESAGIRLAPAVYGLVMLIPLISLAVLLMRESTTSLLVLLAVILAIGFYSSGPGRKRSCVACKMRLCCKGSIAE